MDIYLSISNYVLEYPISRPCPAPSVTKNAHGNILGTKRGIRWCQNDWKKCLQFFVFWKLNSKKKSQKTYLKKFWTKHFRKKLYLTHPHVQDDRMSLGQCHDQTLQLMPRIKIVHFYCGLWTNINMINMTMEMVVVMVIDMARQMDGFGIFVTV